MKRNCFALWGGILLLALVLVFPSPLAANQEKKKKKKNIAQKDFQALTELLLEMQKMMGLQIRDFQRKVEVLERENSAQKNKLAILWKQYKKDEAAKKAARRKGLFPPYSLLSDFIPLKGEDKDPEALYSRWLKKQKGPLFPAMKRFIAENFIIRDGQSWASEKPNVSTRVSVEKALERIGEADVVFLGEQHNQAGDHLLEIFFLNLILSGQKNVAVFMEMFERQTQPLIDEYLQGKITEKVFLEKLKKPSMKGLWPNYAKDYRPVVELCREAGLPLIAGFPPRRYASTVAMMGQEALYKRLNVEKRKLVSRKISIPGRGYRERCMESFEVHADMRRAMIFKRIQKDPSMVDMMSKMLKAMASKKINDRMFFSQCIKDSTMAEGIADYHRQYPGKKIYVIVGAGHISYGSGVVDLLKRMNPKIKTLTLTTLHPRIYTLDKKMKYPYGDLIFFTDSIETYIAKYPKGMSQKEFDEKVDLLKKLNLLELYRNNGAEQDKAMRAIEKERGLKFKYPVNCRIMTQEESDKEVTGWSKGKKVRQGLSKEEKALKAFKLIQKKENLARKGEEHRKSSIMGFYRPSTKYLYIFPSKAGKKTWGLRVHESIHALQDQWFDLGQLHKKGTTDDGDFALTSLIEGEAVYLMMKVLGMGGSMKKMLYGKGGKPGASPHGKSPHGKSPHGGGKKAGEKEAKPDYFKLRTLLIYRKGAQFIKHLVDKKGWKGVSQAFQNPPTTSSEILHPERFLQGFKAEKVSLPKTGKNWKVIDKGDFGEFRFFILLRLHDLPEKRAYKLAESWRGDAFELIRSPVDKNTYKLIYHSAWENEKKATRIMKVLEKIFPKSRIHQKGNVVLLSRTFEMK